jgi:hypothetical protein
MPALAGLVLRPVFVGQIEFRPIEAGLFCSQIRLCLFQIVNKAVILQMHLLRFTR